MTDELQGPELPKKAAPTLYLIIAMKLGKGVFFALLALGFYALSDNDLPEEYKSLMHELHRWARINPDQKFWVDLAAKVGELTETRMLRVALGTLIYSLFALVEGVGLMFRVPWAGWLSIGESAFFIPIEVFELIHNFNIWVFIVMVLNVFMVWYLFQNRERLFSHHH